MIPLTPDPPMLLGVGSQDAQGSQREAEGRGQEFSRKNISKLTIKAAVPS